jgi:hypothetical protein
MLNKIIETNGNLITAASTCLTFTRPLHHTPNNNPILWHLPHHFQQLHITSTNRAIPIKIINILTSIYLTIPGYRIQFIVHNLCNKRQFYDNTNWSTYTHNEYVLLILDYNIYGNRHVLYKIQTQKQK